MVIHCDSFQCFQLFVVLKMLYGLLVKNSNVLIIFAKLKMLMDVWDGPGKSLSTLLYHKVVWNIGGGGG